MRGQLLLSGIGLLCVFGAGCGQESVTTARPVAIPSVTITCARSTEESCEGKIVEAYWATGDCSVADLNAKKYAVGVITRVATANCDATDCAVTVPDVTPWINSVASTATTIASGTYNLCVYIDSTDYGGQEQTGDTGDYFGVIQGVVVNGTTTTQSVSSYSVIL